MSEKLHFNEAKRDAKTLKVLAIGNSFSRDATSYLRYMAMADNVDLRIGSAVIGGCSLERHYDNITNDTCDYSLCYYTNDEVFPNQDVSLEQCLTSNDWDMVTIQQVSNLSGNYESYFPFADGLVDYIKGILPNVKLLIHMTWAYAKYFPRIYSLGYGSQANMHNLVVDSYEKLSKHFNNATILPSGIAMNIARGNPLIRDDVHSDGFHCSELGRLLTGWVWFECLTGISAVNSKLKTSEIKASYMDGNLDIEPEIEAILRDAAHKAAEQYK